MGWWVRGKRDVGPDMGCEGCAARAGFRGIEVAWTSWPTSSRGGLFRYSREGFLKGVRGGGSIAIVKYELD